jgi:hypothetical protein
MAKRAVAVAFTMLVACSAPAPRARAPSKIERLAPSDFLTSDLDFVIRIDAHRLRSEPAIDLAARGLAGGDGSSMLRAILPALEGARAIFVGGRFMADGFHGDGILAIEPASNAEIEAKPLDSSFHAVRAPAHLAIFERNTSARDEAALEIVLERGGVVLATAAEADAVLRIARSGPDADRFDPPARGLASFAGRISSVDASADEPATTPTFRRIARGLGRCSGFVEGGDALHVEIELVYGSADAAADAVSAARSLLGRMGQAPGPLKNLADSLVLDRDAEVVRARAAVPFAVIAELH